MGARIRGVARSWPLWLAVVTLATATAASGPNLLANPDFDTEIAGWPDPFPDANTTL